MKCEMKSHDSQVMKAVFIIMGAGVEVIAAHRIHATSGCASRVDDGNLREPKP